MSEGWLTKKENQCLEMWEFEKGERGREVPTFERRGDKWKGIVDAWIKMDGK